MWALWVGGGGEVEAGEVVQAEEEVEEEVGPQTELVRATGGIEDVLHIPGKHVSLRYS